MKKMSFSKCHSWCSQPIYVASKCHSLVYQTLNFIVLSYREFIVWWMDITIVKIGKSGAVCNQYCHELRGPMTWNFQICQTSWMEQWTWNDSCKQWMDFLIVIYTRCIEHICLPSVMDYPRRFINLEFNRTLKRKWHRKF